LSLIDSTYENVSTRGRRVLTLVFALREAEESLQRVASPLAPCREEAAVVHLSDVVGTVDKQRVMRRDHRSDVALGDDRLDEVHHARSGAAVELTRGLVGDEHVGARDEGTSETYALLLTTRELVGPLLGV